MREAGVDEAAIGPRATTTSVVDGCEGRNVAVRVGVGSFSLLRLLSRAVVMWALTSLIMRHENAL